MAKKFKDVSYACATHETTGPANNKNLSDTSYILFYDRFTKDEVLKKIKSEELKCANCSDGNLKIEARKTSLQKLRNYSMARAHEILEEYVATKQPKRVVSFDWGKPGGSRKVKVDNVDAFVQASGESRGRFCNEYSEIAFTDRK